MEQDKIKIDKNSRIVLQDNNYKLEYRVKCKEKPDGAKPVNDYRWELGGYFRTLDNLAESWIDNYPSHCEENIKTLKELIKVIRDARDKIIKLIN